MKITQNSRSFLPPFLAGLEIYISTHGGGCPKSHKTIFFYLRTLPEMFNGETHFLVLKTFKIKTENSTTQLFSNSLK